MSHETSGRMGWSLDPLVLCPYEVDLTVSEGGWDDSYRARFDLVFAGEGGIERVLVTGARIISGWER